jgi:Tol biopolymer transport system component
MTDRRRPRRSISGVIAICVVAALSLATASLASPAAPARDGMIVFDTGPEECARHIFAFEPAGGDLHELGEGAEAKFSPDGERIVFTTPCDAAQTIDIGVMNANGSDSRVVLGGGHSLRNPSFSPDGRHLIYVRESEGGDRGAVWIADADGSGPRLLRRADGSTRFPTYSPNGRVVVFQVNHLIYTMRSDGSDMRLLTPGAAPSISPGGHLLAYSDHGGIWTIRLGGGHSRLLVRQFSGGQHEGLPGLHVRNVSPTFSPDGRLILFARVANRGNPAFHSRLWTIGLDGSDLRRIAPEMSGPGPAYRPAWQPLP